MAAAKQVMGGMMSGTFLVALGAFTISAALTKYQLSYRLAHLVLSRVGRNPKIVMAAVMFIAMFLSMWISNVAAPLVCAALVGPMLQSLPQEVRPKSTRFSDTPVDRSLT